MHRRLLGVRRHEIADLGAVRGDSKSVDPGLPNGFSGRIVIGVILEIFHDKIIGRRENPHGTFHCTCIANRINPPVVSGVFLKRPGIIAFGPKVFAAFVLGRSDASAAHGRLVRAEIHLMRSRIIRRLPLQNLIILHIHGTMNRPRIPDGARRRETPDVALKGLDAVKLVNSPVKDLA